jgi:hypothetical protein
MRCFPFSSLRVHNTREAERLLERNELGEAAEKSIRRGDGLA